MTVICRGLLLGASFFSPAMMDLAASQEPGNRELGLLIAQEWCSDCHRINERAMPRVGTAPDFHVHRANAISYRNVIASVSSDSTWNHAAISIHIKGAAGCRYLYTQPEGMICVRGTDTELNACCIAGVF